MELKYGTWTVSSYEPADARALCAAGFSPITAALLCSRGYRDADAAREFLSCSYPLSSPFDLLDMDKAAARVRLALQRREHIAVFGDYDVDGITATCLLTEYLRSRGGHVTSYIPARLEEGYGLNPLAIDTLKKQGVELIVTPGGARTLGLGPEDLAQYAEAVYDCADLAAPPSAVHLRNMYELARFGAVVFPPVPAWYAKPQSLEEAERQIAARILAQFGVEAPGAPCWG